ncbi:MAG: cation-translocating P-type ATPase [Oscillatoriales cyanobacterium SM2_2_1]|nr:cation-translocating P-type ATPase [Oscillatoriales cyanobacterium SM2_2_1]
MAEVVLQVRGMGCAACVPRVQRAIAAVEGVLQCEVNFATERATVRVVELRVLPRVLEAVVAAGYAAEPATRHAEVTATGFPWSRSLIVGGVGSTLLMIGGVPMMTGLPMPPLVPPTGSTTPTSSWP